MQTAGGPLSYRKISRLVIKKRCEEETPRLSSRSSQRQPFASGCRYITSFYRCSSTLLSGFSPHQDLLFTLSWVLWECGGTKSLLPLTHAWSNTLDSFTWCSVLVLLCKQRLGKTQSKDFDESRGTFFVEKNCCTALQMSAIIRNLSLPITQLLFTGTDEVKNQYDKT